jgi:hypothetical protein
MTAVPLKMLFHGLNHRRPQNTKPEISIRPNGCYSYQTKHAASGACTCTRNVASVEEVHILNIELKYFSLPGLTFVESFHFQPVDDGLGFRSSAHSYGRR